MLSHDELFTPEDWVGSKGYRPRGCQKPERAQLDRSRFRKTTPRLLIPYGYLYTSALAPRIIIGVLMHYGVLMLDQTLSDETRPLWH